MNFGAQISSPTAAQPALGPMLSNPAGGGSSAYSYAPIGEQGGSLFYSAPPSSVFSGNSSRPSYVYQGFSDPNWFAQNTTPGNYQGQSGFYITPQNAANPNFSLKTTGDYRGQKKDDGGVLGSIFNNPFINIAAQFTPFAPIYDAADAAYQASQKNWTGAALSAYGAGATSGYLPTPSNIWDSVTGAPAPTVGFDTPGGMSIPGGGGPQSTTAANLEAVDNGAFSAGDAAMTNSFNTPSATPDFGGLNLDLANLGGPTGTSVPSSAGGFFDTFGLGDVSMPSVFGSGNWGDLLKPKNLFNAGTGLYGLYQGNQMQKLAATLGRQADPAAGQRGMYQQMLSQLMQNPGSITGLPGYQAGLDAVNRSAAAGGQLGGGGGALAESTYGSNLFNQQAQLYAALGGFGATPGAGASAQLAGTGSALALQGSSLNRLGQTFFPQ